MMTIDRIRKQAALQPDVIAYRWKDGFMTYGTLWSEAVAAAEALSRWNTHRVILYGEKEGTLVIGMLACLISGKTYIPVTAGTPHERILQICAATAPGLILTDRQDIACGIPVRSLRDLNHTAPDTKDAELEESHRENPFAYMIFTSGSTGQPKGVPISRDNLDHFVQWICNLAPLHVLSGIRVMNQAAFSFDLSVADLYYTLCTGNTLCALPADTNSDPVSIVDFLRLNQCALMVCTPTFLKLCLLNQFFRTDTLPDLRCVYSCGETLEPATAQKLLNRFPELTLINAYGPTEATSAVCACTITREMADSGEPFPVGSINRAACQVSIRDGEIILQGKSVFSGYLGQSEAQIHPTGEGHSYPTGDYGYIQNGLLYCEGRRDRQVKWKGYRIELDEIEHHISQIPGVNACAVITKRSSDGIVRFLKAFVSGEGDLSSEAIRAYLRQHLPDYMVPKVICKLPQLPVNSNGKTDRKELERI